MANFFKRLFGKNESPESNMGNSYSDNVKLLNNIFIEAFQKGDSVKEICQEFLKNKAFIEKAFPNEPTLFNDIYYLVPMVLTTLNSPSVTDERLARLVEQAKESHIEEKSINLIVALKNKKVISQGYVLDRNCLEFKLLPLIVNTYNEALKNGGVAQGKEDIFMDINFWQHIARTMNYGSCDFDWHDLSFHKQLVGHLQCIAMTFPKPLKSPQAKYGLVVIDKKAHYFTLEKTALSPTVDKAEEGVGDDLWYLCGIEDGKHVNYCPINRNLTLLQFIEIALQKIYQIKL